ncbi:hypothetical protein BOX15_Mlig008263g4, partial [Macrostomum lignano]
VLKVSANPLLPKYSIMKSTLLFISSILLLFAVDQVFSLRFHLPSNAKKCFREEIHKNVLVKGDYSISDDPNQKVTIKVKM